VNTTVNGLSFDVEDWFQVENLRGAIKREDWDRMPLRVADSTRSITAALARTDTKATFFFLGWVAERLPDLVREISDAGHEIAAHGYGHELVYRMTPEEFRQDIRRTKRLLEDLTGKPVLGYRAPSFSITADSLWAVDVLFDEGFQYDSSVFPIGFHDRYGLQQFGERPFVWPCGLKEIPLAVAKVAGRNFPAAGGGYFRLLPYALTRALLRTINSHGNAFAFYMHPWEFDPGQPRVALKASYRFRHYTNLSSAMSKLQRLLNDFRFGSMRSAFSI